MTQYTIKNDMGHGTVDGSEIRRENQLRLVVYSSQYLRHVLCPSQVVVLGFLSQQQYCSSIDSDKNLNYKYQTIWSNINLYTTKMGWYMVHQFEWYGSLQNARWSRLSGRFTRDDTEVGVFKTKRWGWAKVGWWSEKSDISKIWYDVRFWYDVLGGYLFI